MFVKCSFVCSTDKCDCDSYFLTTTKTEHSRILKYEMGIFSEIVRLIHSSVYFFQGYTFLQRYYSVKILRYDHFWLTAPTVFVRSSSKLVDSKILTWSRASPFEVTVHQILRK